MDIKIQFTVDKEIPYRLYIGENKDFGWVDIKDVRSNFDCEKIIFEDLSPIIRIKSYKNFSILEIDKLKSKWFFYYGDVTPQLRLIEPKIEDEYGEKIKKSLDSEIIFEYGRSEKCQIMAN